MNTFKHTSRGRPSLTTLHQRQIERRKDDEACAWGALIWVHRDIAADIDLRYWAAGLDGAARVFGEIGDVLDSRDGWHKRAPDEWMFHRDGELMAEVFKSYDSTEYTAIVWHAAGNSECASILFPSAAMRWCDDRLRAATLNARVDEAKAGAVDDSEDNEHEQYLAESADAKDDHDYSLPF